MASELCMNCFSVKGQYEVCPFCGYVEGTKPKQPHYLTPVGNAIGFGGFGITYKCFDTTLGVVVAVKEFYPAGLVNRAPGECSVGLLSGDKQNQYQAQLKRFLMEAQSNAQFGKAKDIVNGYSEMELYRIIRDYGEEKFAKNIAKHIVNARQQKEIETTGELIQIIKAAIPMKVRAVGGHPAKKTFQAIRIELNRELEVLRDSLDSMIDFLNDGGRICVITFHSLEDRIVKNNFRKNENPCICPREFPVCVCGRKSKGFVVTRKPIIPGEEELTYNKRAKSSKLRVFERRREEEES